MNKLFEVGFICLVGFVLFSCQNDLNSTVNDMPEEVVALRAAPEDAIEISPVDGVLTLEGGNRYVINGFASVESITSTGSASNVTILYIAGAVDFSSREEEFIVPDGVQITIQEYGVLLGLTEYITLGENTALYIENGGSLQAQAYTVRFRQGVTNGLIANYGQLSVSDLEMNNCAFYNMAEGTATVCDFNPGTNDKNVNNFGTFVDCSGNPYDY